jgi:hypothetical protein
MSGVANVYTAVMDPPITAYADGQLFSLEVLTANTGPSTLAVDGLATPRKICKFTYGTASDALVDVDDGDLIANSPVLLLYLASVKGGVGAFVLLNAPAKSAILHGVCEGTVVNTYTVLVDGPLNTSLATPKNTLLGRLITFTTPSSNANTGAVTVTIKTVTGSTPLPALALNRGGSALVPGELPVNFVVWCWFDGTDLEWLNPGPRTFVKQESFTAVKNAVQPYSAAHGLGTVPTRIELALKCTTSQHGYQVNEEVRLPPWSVEGDDFVWWVDATNVYFRTTGPSPNIFKRDASGYGAVTDSSWSLVIRAEL